ncbi:RNA 2',3'-cyclic phosphodiesterase [Candidatus Fermentibacteria bacterium]|nr:MAG: RNA 2',3'-cyclic phosphodiesterase [Candidatus Fermentibacteria bacterium]
MRLFIAMELPSEVRRSISDWIEPLSRQHSDLRWTSCENLHVTLRFLGNVNPDSVIQKMKESQIKSFLPVEFTLNRLGTFGRPSSVLWVSGKFSEGVFDLAEKLGSIPDDRGLTKTCRYCPHITVARARRGFSIPFLPWRESLIGASSTIGLYSSELTGKGSVYTILHSTGL